MIDVARFVEVMRFAALQAGAVARRLQAYVPHERKKATGSAESEALTVIDLASQDLLLRELHRAFPEVSVDAEEDTELVHLFAPERPNGPVVVVDPIDGTLNYTRGSDDYAVMVALIAEGVYQASVLHFPNHAMTCWAQRGAGCFVERGSRTMRVREAPASSEVLVSPKVPAAIQEALGGLGRVTVSRCSAVDAAAPAIGRAKLSLSSDRADRRRAIGFLPTVEAGGSVLFGDQRWRGEDPARLPKDAAPSIAAASEALAVTARSLVRR